MKRCKKCYRRLNVSPLNPSVKLCDGCDNQQTNCRCPSVKCGYCKDTGVGPWIMGDILRACHFCAKGAAMELSGWAAPPSEPRRGASAALMEGP